MLKAKTYISWAGRNGRFFKGDGGRPLTRFERDALVAVCAITVYLVLIRLYEWIVYIK